MLLNKKIIKKFHQKNLKFLGMTITAEKINKNNEKN
jgi:hypothetical protein